MSEVTIVKLVSGEEIIGTISEDTGDINKIHLNDVMRIALYDTPNGPQLGFEPWGITSEDPKKIKYEHIVYKSSPIDPVRQQYQQATGKIVTPPTQIIAG